MWINVETRARIRSKPTYAAAIVANSFRDGQSKRPPIARDPAQQQNKGAANKYTLEKKDRLQRLSGDDSGITPE